MAWSPKPDFIAEIIISVGAACQNHIWKNLKRLFRLIDRNRVTCIFASMSLTLIIIWSFLFYNATYGIITHRYVVPSRENCRWMNENYETKVDKIQNAIMDIRKKWPMIDGAINTSLRKKTPLSIDGYIASSTDFYEDSKYYYIKIKKKIIYIDDLNPDNDEDCNHLIRAIMRVPDRKKVECLHRYMKDYFHCAIFNQLSERINLKDMNRLEFYICTFSRDDEKISTIFFGKNLTVIGKDTLEHRMQDRILSIAFEN